MIKRFLIFFLAISSCLLANAELEKITCTIIPVIDNTAKFSNESSGEIRVLQMVHCDGSGFSWIINFFKDGKIIASQRFNKRSEDRRISMFTDEGTGSVFITCFGNPKCEYQIAKVISSGEILYYVMFRDSNSKRYLALIDSAGYNKIIRQLNAAANSNIIDLYKSSDLGEIALDIIAKGLLISSIHVSE